MYRKKSVEPRMEIGGLPALTRLIPIQTHSESFSNEKWQNKAKAPPKIP